MSKKSCTWVELNKTEVLGLMNDVSGFVKEAAEQVASTAGAGATVKMGTRSKRPVAFVNMPYDKASKDNKLIKSVFGSEK